MTSVSLSGMREAGAQETLAAFNELKKLQVMVRQKEERIRELHEEIHSLDERLKNSEREKTLIVATLEDRVVRKTDHAIDLEAALKEQAQAGAREKEGLVRAHEETAKKRAEAAGKALEEAEDSRAQLASEVKELVHFKAEKSELTAEAFLLQTQVGALRKKLDEQKIGYEERIAALKRTAAAREHEVNDLIKRESNTKARHMISEIEKNIEEQNERLSGQLEQQKAMIERLRGEKDFYEKQWRENQRDKELISGTVSGYKAAHSEQQKKIKMLSGRIELLEKSLAQIVKDFEKEKELIKFKHEQALTQQAARLKSLQRTLALKASSLRSLRALAQLILDQRSDVEQFFLEALEQIKEEVRRKLVQEKKQRARLPPLPGAPPGPAGEAGPKPYSDKVDLNDRDWEDRERVLRLLFSKMNAGVPASHWRAFAPHARPEDGDEEDEDPEGEGDYGAGEGDPVAPWPLEAEQHQEEEAPY